MFKLLSVFAVLAGAAQAAWLPFLGRGADNNANSNVNINSRMGLPGFGIGIGGPRISAAIPGLSAELDPFIGASLFGGADIIPRRGLNNNQNTNINMNENRMARPTIPDQPLGVPFGASFDPYISAGAYMGFQPSMYSPYYDAMGYGRMGCAR